MLELYSNTGRDLNAQERMLEVVLERILVLTHTAGRAIEEKDFEKAHVELMRGQFALSILQATVSPELSAELQGSLRQLYGYMGGRLAEANLTKDIEPLGAVRSILHNLLEAVRGRSGKKGGDTL